MQKSPPLPESKYRFGIITFGFECGHNVFESIMQTVGWKRAAARVGGAEEELSSEAQYCGRGLVFGF